MLCSREEELFQLISHDRGVGLYVPPPPACDLMKRESAAALTQKPRRVES